ncbi:hypothetical protein POM88_051108 [Heracleum sosnowskyi]|uniref:Uncharacterized protein n=1 Tax=Heracleum sosnowskyi TaxID=360622 RepID=A0AAD8H1A5_9APIA|nr:hypothetical protein POM88_051108 [Heracleum sosnowskyi]
MKIKISKFDQVTPLKYPLIDGVSVKCRSHNISDDLARNCGPGSLDKSKVKGRIILCFNEIGGAAYKMKEIELKILEIIGQGGRGVILVQDDFKIESSTVLPGFLKFPCTFISSKDGNATLSYIRSNR